MSRFLWGIQRQVRALSPVELCKSALLSTQKSSYSLPIGLTVGIGGFLLRCHRAVTPAIVFAVAPRGDRRVSAWESGVSGVHWDFEGLLKWWDDTSSSSRASSGDCLLLRCDGNARIHFLTKQEKGSSSRHEERKMGLFFRCGWTHSVPLE